MPSPPLSGQIALVTGASRGIGRAIALELARRGADLAIGYAASRDQAFQLRDELQKLGVRADVFPADLSKPQAAGELVAQVQERLGSVSILVNNAGVARDNLLLRMKDEEWEEVIATNLTGAFRCLRACARSMLKARSGRIINISSVVGLRGNAGQANYAASKGGLIGLTKSAAKELGPRGITVNAIAPGFIETDMTAVVREGLREQVIPRIAVGSLGRPEDVAAVAAFLASPEARYVNGEVIGVDGGLSI